MNKVYRPLVAALMGCVAMVGVAGAPAGVIAGELVIAQSLEPTGFDPTGHVFPLYHNQAYDTLVKTDETGAPHPVLAESWSRSADGLTVTFKLRGDAKFHTGRTVAADDIVFTIERYQTESVGANIHSRLKPITAVRALDPATVEMTLAEPMPGLLDLLSDVFIQNKDVIDQLAYGDAGSGRYVIQKWTPGQPLILERFADHWDNANTTLDRIEIRTMADSGASAAALQTGDVDMIVGADYTIAEEFLSRAGYKVERPEVAPRTVYVAISVANAPLDNQQVRQAISYAMDRQKMVDIAYGGYGEASCQAWASPHWAYDSALALGSTSGEACEFNLDKAKALLDEANAGPISISINTATESYSPGSAAIGQILQEDLSKIGVKLEIMSYEAAKARQLLLDGDFELLTHGYIEAGSDPQTMFPSGFMGPGGRTKFTSPRYEELVTAANATIEPAERKKIYAEISRLLLDESFMNIVVHTYRAVPMKEGVNGLKLDNLGMLLLSGMTVD